MRCLLAVLLALAPVAVSATPLEEIRAGATYPLRWTEQDLTGPGADFLFAAFRKAQFVLIGEDHNDRDTPLFTRTLYRVLHREDGFAHLVVEQDPLGIELALSEGQRGSAPALGRKLRTWPTLLGFASDQDLALLADAGAIGAGPDAIWGLEQAQSPVRYLEELVVLAPPGPVHADVTRLLDRARHEEQTRADFAKFLGYDRQTLPDLRTLAAQWQPAKGSRSADLLEGLLKSAEIYDYYVRAHTEADPALTYFNGTVREAWLKAQFTRHYRAVGGEPKALFKFGDNHIRGGVGSTGAWTLGTFVADLATYDGMDAYSILVVPVGGDVPDWRHLPAELVPLLPAERPQQPTVVDLGTLRPHADSYIDAAPVAVRQATRGVLFGFDAIVVLPDSAPASWKLTGFPPP